jgi:hypothetical protein
MTASPGREVDVNLLSGAALGSTHARTGAQDAGDEDLGDLVQTLGGRHEVGAERIGQSTSAPGYSTVERSRTYQMIN